LERKKFKDVILDFTYFAKQDTYEANIRKNLEISDLDEEFRDSYADLLERFYTVFRSIYLYISDYDKLVKDLNNKAFINLTIETALASHTLRALLAEGLAQYGVMIMIMDFLLPGPIREAIIVSYYRYKGQAAIPNMSEVIKICSSSSLIKSVAEGRRADYPVELFKRHNVDETFVTTLIDYIKEDDVYEQMKSYPSTQHKSVALASQASLIFILLYFVSPYLDGNYEKMRDIVNKHFFDNWVITYFQGFTIDLFDAWKSFKAASQALNKTLTIERVKELAVKYKNDMTTLNAKLTTQVMEACLQQEYALDNTIELFNLITCANVTMRWLLLHRNTRVQKFKEIICSGLDVNSLLDLVLRTSEFESQFKVVQKDLLNSKQALFENCRAKCLEYMTECAEFFAGNRKLGKVIKNDQYSTYFNDMGKHLEKLKCRPSKTPPLIQGYTNSLDSIATYPLVNTNLQIKFYITETVTQLKNMAKIASLRKDSLNRLALIGDFSYAWNLLDDYIEIMHKNIKKNTKAVLLFRSCFIKLASILNQPLRRIIELNDEEMLKNVSQYYSSQLVQFVGRVLSVIPISIYELLEQMTQIMTRGLRAEEAKITKEDLLGYALFEDRFQLAKHAHRISLFAEGMLSMDKCLMGVIEVDPKEFLVNGLKNEMVKIITKELHNSLIFKKELTIEVFDSIIKSISVRLDNMRAALEYVQDLIGIDALHIWLEQMTRIINFYVNREANAKEILKTRMNNEGKDKNLIEIPMYEPIDGCSTFLGRLVQGLLNITSPTKNLFYLAGCNSWYDAEGNLVFGPKTVRNLIKTFGVVGITGLDKIISYNISKEINSYAKIYKRLMDSGNKLHIDVLRREIRSGFVNEPSEVLRQRIDKSIESLQNANKQLFAIIERIGRMQLLRKVIQQQLMQMARVDSKGFYQVIYNLNKCAIPSFIDHKNGEKLDLAKDEDYAQMKAQRAAEMEFLKFVSNFVDAMGISNPFNKIYLYPRFEMYSISHMLAVMTIDYLKATSYNQRLSTFNRKKLSADNPDSSALLAGIVTMLKHMHINYTHEYIATLCFYSKMAVGLELLKKKRNKFDPTSTNIYIWLNEYCKITEQHRDIISKHSSGFVFDSFPNEV